MQIRIGDEMRRINIVESFTKKMKREECEYEPDSDGRGRSV